MIFRFGTLFFQDPQLDGNFRLRFRDHGIIKTCGINRSRSVELVLKHLMEKFHRSSKIFAGKKVFSRSRQRWAGPPVYKKPPLV